MNKSSKLLVLTIPLILGALFAISFIPGNSNIEIQNIELTPQEQIDLELSNGHTNIDGVWYADEWLEVQVLVQKMADEGLPVPLQIGGIITATHYDANGKQISTQQVHNRVVDEGEDFLIEQLFKDGTAGEGTDGDQLATICVSAEVSFVDTSETKTAATFDSADNLGAVDNCITDAAVAVASQVATIGALTFDAPTHVPATTTITGIAICQGEADGGDPTPFNLCREAQSGSSGIMFSQINIGDVTLQNLETVDITYNLDVSSAGS